jgi:hypothetical protein
MLSNTPLVMSSSDGSFNNGVASLQSMLEDVNNKYNTYKAQKTSQASFTAQNGGLQNSVAVLNAKLMQANNLADTYDREFEDRMADKKTNGFWSSRGINSLQDWVLFIFYAIYVLITIGLLIIVATMSRSPLLGSMMVLGLSFVLGVMMTAVIIRFA